MSYVKCHKTEAQRSAKKILNRINTSRRRRKKNEEEAIERRIKGMIGEVRRTFLGVTISRIKNREEAVEHIDSIEEFSSWYFDGNIGDISWKTPHKYSKVFNREKMACLEILSLCEKSSNDFIYLSGEHSAILDIEKYN